MAGRLARDVKQSKPFSSRSLEAYLNLLRTTDRLSRSASELLKPHELSETPYNILRILRGAGEEGLPCGEIAARLLTVDPDVTRLLDRLERRELVARSRGTRDRRVVQVRITATGLALLDAIDLDRQLLEAHRPHFSRLTAAQIDTLIDLLELLRGDDDNPTIPGKDSP